MTDAKVLDKIQKLLALAKGNGASEQEVETCMKNVHALLTKHNLSMNDVLDNNESVTRTRVERESNREWTLIVWYSTAELYYCDLLYNNNYFSIIGLPANAKTVEVMAQHFCGAIKDLAVPHCSGLGRAYHNSFYMGAAMRIRNRVHQHIQEIVAQELKNNPVVDGQPTSNALTVATLYEKCAVDNVKFINENIRIKKVSSKKNTVKEVQAFHLGQQAADNISLNRPISGGVQ